MDEQKIDNCKYWNIGGVRSSNSVAEVNEEKRKIILNCIIWLLCTVRCIELPEKYEMENMEKVDCNANEILHAHENKLKPIDVRIMHWCFEHIIMRNVCAYFAGKKPIKQIFNKSISRVITLNLTQFHENLFAFIFWMVKTKQNQFVNIIGVDFQCEDTKSLETLGTTPNL